MSTLEASPCRPQLFITAFNPDGIGPGVRRSGICLFVFDIIFHDQIGCSLALRHECVKSRRCSILAETGAPTSKVCLISLQCLSNVTSIPRAGRMPLSDWGVDTRVQGVALPQAIILEEQGLFSGGPGQSWNTSLPCSIFQTLKLLQLEINVSKRPLLPFRFRHAVLKRPRQPTRSERGCLRW